MALAVGGCGSEAGVVEIELDEVRTLIGEDAGLLAAPIDLVIGDDGAVYVSDASDSRIVAYEPELEGSRFIGRQGQEPGEFCHPRAIGLVEGKLLIADWHNGRIQWLDLEGNSIAAYPVPELAASRLMAVGPGGHVAFEIDGDALVEVVDGNGDTVALIGDLVVPSPEEYSYAAIRADIERRRVPDAFRNQALPIFAPDGDLWVVLNAEGELRR